MKLYGFRFHPDYSNLLGKQLPRLIGSLLTASVVSVAGIALAAEEDDKQEHRQSFTEEEFVSFSNDRESDSVSTEKTTKTNFSADTNGDSRENASQGAVLGVGVSEMMPTEFEIESDDYGTGQYRRYIGYYIDDGGTKRKSGKLVQEILVSRDDAEAVGKLPKLAMPGDKAPEVYR